MGVLVMFVIFVEPPLIEFHVINGRPPRPLKFYIRYSILQFVSSGITTKITGQNNKIGHLATIIKNLPSEFQHRALRKVACSKM